MKLCIRKNRCHQRSQFHGRHYQHQQQQQHKFPGRRQLRRIHCYVLMEMLLQKEKDLELAAKIGQTLLEQNQELRNRSFFELREKFYSMKLFWIWNITGQTVSG